MNRNCPKYSPWLCLCDAGCSILLGYQHRYKALSSLSWLVSCSGDFLGDRNISFILTQCTSPGGISPFPRIGQLRILLKAWDLVWDPGCMDQRVWTKPRWKISYCGNTWRIHEELFHSAVPALGQACLPLGGGGGSQWWGVVRGGFSAHQLLPHAPFWMLLRHINAW